MTSQATPAASSDFVREVTSYEHEMLKALRVLEATKSESLKYDDLSSEIESEVQSMEQDLVALGQQLLQQKQVRRHREMCEDFAKEVNSVDDRKQLQKKIRQADDSLLGVQGSLSEIENKIQIRAQQFDLLKKALREFTAPFSKEESSSANGDSSNADENMEHDGRDRDREAGEDEDDDEEQEHEHEEEQDEQEPEEENQEEDEGNMDLDGEGQGE